MNMLLAAGALALVLVPAVASADPADPAVGLFAQAAGVSNAFELAEATIVLEDSTDPGIRRFAEIMREDHGKAQAALARAGTAAGVPTAFVLDRVDQKKVDDLGLMDSPRLDRAYLDDQIEAHASAAATLSDYARNGTDPALRDYARATLPVVLEHQRMLSDLSGRPPMM